MAAAAPRGSPAAAALLQATAGAGSAVAAALALHPLELTKTRIQTGQAKGPITSAAARIASDEGLAALYRGVSAQCFEELLENFVFFYVYGGLMRLVQRGQDLSMSLNLLIGYVAGVCTTTCVMPVETLSTRLQLSSGEGPWTLLCRVLRDEGPGALFSGIGYNIVLCANPAIQNTFFDRLKSAILVRRDARLAPGSRRAALSALEASTLGALAKALALFLCYPLVRMKVLKQAAHDKKEPQNGRESSSEDVLTPVQYAGLLYRGLGAALSKNIVSAALMYSLKEKIASLVVAGLKKLMQRPALR